MMGVWSTRPAVAAAAAVAVIALAGCQGASITDVTLPGGATSSNVFGTKPTNTYVVMFNDALDLVPQSSVQMNDVNVGDVRSITLDDGQAKVTIRVLKSVTVPANVEGVLSQTSLLGEKFVNLVVPGGDAAVGQLAPGSVIATDKTSDELQVEDVFGALSELLNGGGIQQLQSISTDLSQLLTHRETSLRDLLSQLTTLTTSLDSR
jgi:phospholipid/cholesterol/gamma-HCH transport system substrate-binding protein